MSENRQPVIYLDKPAAEWEDAYPVGGGSVGGMLFGGTDRERLQLNEESIWSGSVRDTTVPGFREKLDAVRALLLEGRGVDADELASESMQGCFDRVKSYETAGDIYVTVSGEGDVADYRRELLLDDGVAVVTYKKGGVSYKRECFASYPSRLVAIRFTSDAPANYTVSYSRVNLTSMSMYRSGFTAIGETAYGSHGFAVAARVATDGKPTVNGGAINVAGANSLTIFVAMATQYSHGDGYDKVAAETLLAANRGWDALLAEHIADHSPLMKRSRISFKSDPALDALPMSERLARLRNDENARDDGIAPIYFEFGKYLMIGSSRPGTLPANLQGVWNDRLEAPWNADYHTNINLQMNYWHVEVANIGECLLPLADYCNKNLLESGRKTARVDYGVGGSVTHHLSDIYGFTTPADGLWGLWPLGGAWLCFNLWEHFLYTNDREYLKSVYEFIRDSAIFFMEYMYYDAKNDRYLSGPSTSPENRYFEDSSHKKAVSLCMSPTMDIEIIGGLLKIYASVEDMLGIDPELAAKAREIGAKLPPLQIGKHGQLMEWMEDYDEPEPGHRHISHAFALYPDNAITPDTPEYFAAIRKTLERRLSFGGGHTGWSRAWLINLFARLRDGEDAYKNIHALFCRSTRINLFDVHPPFQIDGNFGGAAGIAETLMQSHDGAITILPAVPADMPDGSFTGLRARGGLEVSAQWSHGRVERVALKRVCGDGDSEVIVRFPNGRGEARVKVQTGATVELTPA